MTLKDHEQESKLYKHMDIPCKSLMTIILLADFSPYDWGN
jgi:hypothetical protein